MKRTGAGSKFNSICFLSTSSKSFGSQQEKHAIALRRRSCTSAKVSSSSIQDGASLPVSLTTARLSVSVAVAVRNWNTNGPRFGCRRHMENLVIARIEDPKTPRRVHTKRVGATPVAGILQSMGPLLTACCLMHCTLTRSLERHRLYALAAPGGVLRQIGCASSGNFVRGAVLGLTLHGLRSLHVRSCLLDAVGVEPHRYVFAFQQACSLSALLNMDAGIKKPSVLRALCLAVK